MIENIDSPADLRKLRISELDLVASEIRAMIIDTVSKTGGHLASSLGAVELTIALHYIFNTPQDKLVWDIGHQCYAHKILTGRRKRFSSLRQYGGISGFPNKTESKYDSFGAGHAGTAIAAALGMMAARDIKKSDERIAVVVGDGALSSGLAWEGLNNASQIDSDITIIINDNEMSISRSLGAITTYLSKASSGKVYTTVRNEFERILKGMPVLGETVLKLARKFEVSLKLLSPGLLFEEMGFRYFGPIDGHNLEDLIKILGNVKSLKGPTIIHLLTKKGKGYDHAELDPVKFHGIGKFESETGKTMKKPESYSAAAGNVLCELFKKDLDSVAISAAMLEGTGIAELKRQFPERVFDVGIAEQFAVTFAAGLASSGAYPYVAVYSTFLQRAYDSVIHDVAIQNLPLTLLIDRAGIVGSDGATHQGVFDISYLLPIPNMILMAPADKDELVEMIKITKQIKAPVAIRYPRGEALSLDIKHDKIMVGYASIEREGKDIALFACGAMLKNTLEAADILSQKRINATVVNLRFIKPIDKKLIIRTATNVKAIVTIEEGSRIGGIGQLISSILAENRLEKPIKIIAIDDKFIPHGEQNLLRSLAGLDANSIAKTALSCLVGIKSQEPA